MLDESTLSRFKQQGVMLANRVKKRFKHLHKRFARQHIDVFRLYDGDIPEIRAAVDWYAGHLVMADPAILVANDPELARFGRCQVDDMLIAGVDRDIDVGRLQRESVLPIDR